MYYYNIEQKIRYYSNKCVSLLLLTNNSNFINNCIRGLNLQNIFGDYSYSNISKLNMRKKLFILDNTINKNNINNINNIDLIENNLDNLKENIYDMLIIDKNYFNNTDFNNIWLNQINNFILLINVNIKIDNILGYKIKYYENNIEIIKQYDFIFDKVDINNYSNNYIIFKNIIDLLDKNNIIYTLAGYDCLTAYIFNAHSIFTNYFEICIHNNFKNNLIDIFSAYIIENMYEYIVIKLNNFKLKVYFYIIEELSDNSIKIIFNNLDIFFETKLEDSCVVKTKFGPLNVNIFKNPLSYLNKLFDFNNIKYPLLEKNIYASNILYKDCYDYYSQDRSDKWRIELINAGEKIKQLFLNNDINFWLDGGSLLGAIRNNDIPPGDDDIDFGVFTFDLQKIYNLILPENIYLEGKSDTGCVIRVKIHSILYDIEILGYFKNSCNKYQCNRYGDSPNMKDRAFKCSVPMKYFDKLSNIMLGEYLFPCPSEATEYIELPERYSKNSIENDPQPHVKSGNIKWIDLRGTIAPQLRY